MSTRLNSSVFIQDIKYGRSPKNLAFLLKYVTSSPMASHLVSTYLRNIPHALPGIFS